MKKIIILLIIIIAIAGGAFFFLQHRTNASKPDVDYKFDLISRGDITNLVSSTGTLNVVGTVEVGTQASGTVDQVLVDYNDTVKKGQLLVVMDKTMLNVAIQESEAALTRSKVQLNQVETEYQRNASLFKEGYVSEMTLLNAKTSLETTKASVISSEAALKKARTNLKYTEIRSPINGTVIQMNVDAGQTISPNSSEALLTIAEDLANMQIEAFVDESDISQIKEGMSVRFTVQAYLDKEFSGTVRQVRLKPKTVQDVVNYTVIINAANDEGLLLPGMTATVDFIVEERQNVLLLPNTALNFKPSEDLMAQLRPQFQNPNSMGTTAPQGTTTTGQNAGQQIQAPQGFPGMAAQQDTTGQQMQAPQGFPGMAAQQDTTGQQMQAPQGFPGMAGQQDATGQNARQGQRVQGQNGTSGDFTGFPNNGAFPLSQGTGENAGSNTSSKTARVFYLDDDGNPKMARVVTGATDGSKTEIIQSAQLLEGTRVITGTNTATKKTSEKQASIGIPLPGMGGGQGGPPQGAGGPP